MNWFPSPWEYYYIKLVTHLDKKSKFTQVIFVTENRVSYINTLIYYKNPELQFLCCCISLLHIYCHLH